MLLCFSVLNVPCLQAQNTPPKDTIKNPQEVIVNGTRLDNSSPLAYTNLNKKEPSALSLFASLKFENACLAGVRQSV